MKKPFIIITISTIILATLTYFYGGSSLLIKGLTRGQGTLFQALPLIIIAFIAMGQLQVVLTPETIQRWIERYSGLRGIIISSLAGGIFPGAPYIFFPFISTFKEREIPFYLFFSFIVGKEIYDFTRIPMEMSIIGPGFTLIRYLIILPIPMLMGLIIYLLMPSKTISSYLEGGKENAHSNSDL